MKTMRSTVGVMGTALLALVMAMPAEAEPMTWRQTSVAAGRDGNATLRRGVAILGTGEPATMVVRMEALEPPRDGRMPLLTDMTYHFDDGSTLRLQARSSIPMANGRPVLGESVAEGQVLGGSGRFAGATGSYRLRARNNVDATTDGALGDYFGVVEADVRVPH